MPSRPTNTALQTTLFKTDTIATTTESSEVKNVRDRCRVVGSCLSGECVVERFDSTANNTSDCLLGERFKVKMGLPEWYTNDAVAQYLVQ